MLVRLTDGQINDVKSWAYSVGLRLAKAARLSTYTRYAWTYHTTLLARRLQSVMNAAARLVLSSSKCDHITPLLRQPGCKFHGGYITSWPFWFTKCLHGLAPSYLTDELHHPAESWVSKASLFRFISRSVCYPYPPVNVRRPSFSSRRCTDMEQSSAAHHICSVTQSHFPSSALAWRHLGLLLRTLLPVITVIVPAK